MISITPFFTQKIHPFAVISWTRRAARITAANGDVVFEQENVEFPETWSQNAVNIVASKYFHGKGEKRESSLKQLIGRVAGAIAAWGKKDGYFDDAGAETFQNELSYLLVNQCAAFNSPVWFNVGAPGIDRPQCSACFINSVEDTMESILDLAKTEGMLFKYGSGAGSNLSNIRSSKEYLSTGGKASGPVSFMKGFDAFAGAIKSGGRTRRAAKMVILNCDHPDIEEFVWCKAKEEQKARDLIAAGYDPSIDGEAYASVFFQNANHSVRVTNEFMEIATEAPSAPPLAKRGPGVFPIRAVTTGEALSQISASGLLRSIAAAAHACGDPGMQYDDTIQAWHTCPASGRIDATNPCSEYVFINDTSCNLASLNLLKFIDPNGKFNWDSFAAAVRVMIIAMDILVDNAGYPTPKIEAQTRRFRTLGLGYANLGALLMQNALPYDSDAGRHYAAAVTALLSAEAYKTSAEIAQQIAPFSEYAVNEHHMLHVVHMHAASAKKLVRQIGATRNPQYPADIAHSIAYAAMHAWNLAASRGAIHGFRNAQVSVLAPTGTISFMMDCDTTGVEPDISLVKYKKLVGGGTMKIVNQSVEPALKKLSYNADEIAAALQTLEETGTLERPGILKPEHLPVFDCAFKAPGGSRFISPLGHVNMLAALQPFISGAISKTVNVPEETTVEQIMELYTIGWKLGLKALAIYRDNCKSAQPISASSPPIKEWQGGITPAPSKPNPWGNTTAAQDGAPPARPARRRLPDERASITHKFSVAGHEGYLTVGMYPHGVPGEIFITMSKEGSTISGMMDAFATAVSLALQYGVPLQVLSDKFTHVRYEPSGFTNNPAIPIAKSITDYIFRYLALRCLGNGSPGGANNGATPGCKGDAMPGNQEPPASYTPACPNCGSLTTINGSCYACRECGHTTGCS